MNHLRSWSALLTLLVLLGSGTAYGQNRRSGPPPGQLEALVQPVALYPDPLLSEVLIAATYPDQISPANQWARQHSTLRANNLARAIANDRLPWDSSVQTLLAFPSVLDMMSRDLNWTDRLGNAFLRQQPDVMDAIQQMRRQARDYGYLRSNAQITLVEDGPYIEIQPANPSFVYVPQYDPRVVYVRPRGAFVGRNGITFGPRITIGANFASSGWGPKPFSWSAHTFNNRRSDRERDRPFNSSRPDSGLSQERQERDRQIREHEQDSRRNQAEQPR